MNDKKKERAEEHIKPEIEEDNKEAEKTFKVFYVLTVPGEATVLARNPDEAVDKLHNWEVEEHIDHELASELEIDEVEEVKQ